MRIYELRGLFDGTVLVPLSVSYLYLSGAVYIEGLMNELNLDRDILGIDFHSILYKGFILNFSYLFLFVAIILFSLMLVDLLRFSLLPYALRWWRDSSIYKKFWGATDNNVNSDFGFVSFARNKLSLLIVSVLLVLVSFSVFLLALVEFESSGIHKAQEFRSELRRGNYTKVMLDDNHDYANLYCGNSYCAALRLNDENVVYYPLRKQFVFVKVDGKKKE